MSSYAEHRLEQWGNWSREHGNVVRGYPSEDTISRCIRSGGLVSGSHSIGLISAPPEVDEVELIMCEIQKRYPDVCDVLKLFFYEGLPIYQVGKRLKIGKTSAAKLRDRGIWFVAGALR